jgi:ATP-dependent DNA helicase RecQ
VPIRAAVLRTLDRLAPGAVHLQRRTQILSYATEQHEIEYEWFSAWHWVDEPLHHTFTSQRHHARTGPGESGPPSFPSLYAYFRHYKLLPPDEPGPDVHWAERLFVEEIFVPIFGLEGLSRLEPQVPFTHEAGGRRFIDFVLAGEHRYAIEIEGRQHHDEQLIGPERFRDETLRRRSLDRAGYHYRPFHVAELADGSARATLRRLADRDAELRAFGESAAERAEPDALLANLARLIRRLPARFPVYQQTVLRLLQVATERGQSRVVLVDYHPAVATFALAVLDTVALVERVADLYGLQLWLPELELYVVEPVDQECVTELLAHYPPTCASGPAGAIDAPRSPVSVIRCTEVPAGADYIFTAESLVVTPSDKSASPTPDARTLVLEDLERFNAPFLAAVGSKPPIAAQPRNTDRPVLDYFARRYFTVPELKRQQVTLIQHLLRGESGLGILPTGFGKSLVFQLSALLLPRTTLVISPLPHPRPAPQPAPPRPDLCRRHYL